MRSSSYLSLAAAVFLLLAMASMDAEGIRLDAETRTSLSSSSDNQMAVNVSGSEFLVPCLKL
jgi:hypothetical protein